MSFREAEQLKRRFSEASGGSFVIVYQAMCECARKANGALLKEADVLAAIERRLPPQEDIDHDE